MSPPESVVKGLESRQARARGTSWGPQSPVAIFIFILVIITIANVGAKKYFTVVIALKRVRLFGSIAVAVAVPGIIVENNFIALTI